MSVHVIYYKDGAKMMRPVLSRPEYLALRNSGDQVQTVAAIREGDASLKHKLVQMNYSCLPNEDGSLKGSKTMSTTVGMDIDWTPSPLPLVGEEQTAASKEEWLKKVPELVMGKKEELGLLMLECSATKGYHLVFRRRPELSQEENLKWASELLGVAYDKGAKDITRVFFTTTAAEEDLIFLDDEIFRPTPADPSEDPGRPTPDPSREGRGEAGAEGAAEKSRGQESLPSRGDLEGSEGSSGSESVAAEGRCLAAFDLCAEQAGLNPKAMDVWGEHNWHTNLMAVLSVGVAKLMSRRQLVAVVAERVPNYAQTEDCRKLIDYFYEKYDADKGFMNASLREINAKAQKEPAQEASQPQPQQAAASTEAALPTLPKRLPKLLSLLTRNVEAIYKPCVSMSVFAPLQTHLVGVQWRYVDRVLHEPGDMCLLMAPMASGKSCITKPIEFILSDIVARDSLSRQREQAWRDLLNTKGANKEKPKRPEGLCVQVLVPDMTNAAFVQRLQDAGEHPVYTQMNELDLLTQLRTNGKSGTPTQILRLAFDHDIYGQERVGSQSVNARVRVRWNLNMSTTIQKGQSFFRNAIADGTLSRLSLCTIQRPLGHGMPLFGNYDAAYAEELKPYIDRLNSASGLIECPQAERLIRRMVAEVQQEALERGENPSELSNRALVIAYKRAMTLYVAEGAWSKDIEAFVRWSYAYDMAVKQLFFGELIEREMRGETIKAPRGRKGLLRSLANVFTLEQLRLKCAEQNLNTAPEQLINVWVNRKCVMRRDDGQYEKVRAGNTNKN